jgi:tetratricopeptide (TPR) repeat protein
MIIAAPLCIFILTCSIHAYSRDLVLVKAPDIFIETPDIQNRAHSTVRHAVHLANIRFREYADFLYHDGHGEAYDYKASIQIFDKSLTIQFVDSHGTESNTAAILGELSDHTSLHLSDLFFYQWSSYHDFLEKDMSSPPILVDEMVSTVISDSVLPEIPTALIPTSIASRENGGLLLGFSMICVELNRFYGIVDQPGKSLYESGDYSYAASVASTPGGTIFFKPAMGRTIYRLTPGSEKPDKIRTGMDALGPFIALHDGSVILIDMQKKQTVRFDRGKKTILDLQTGPYSYITAGASGPDNTLWVFDAFERRVRIYSAEGDHIDSIMPQVDPSTGSNVQSLAVYNDGTFILFYSGGLLRAYNRSGTPRWSLSTVGAGFEEALPHMAGLALDTERGIIYLTDQMGSRLLKLLDQSRSGNQEIDVSFEREIAALTLSQMQHPDDWSYTAKKAALYEQKESYEMAKFQWEIVIEKDVAHRDAIDRLEMLEVTILRSQAGELHRETELLLERLGPESARRFYNTTLKMYEQILSLKPDDSETRRRMERLRKSFQQRERGEQRDNMRLRDVEVQFAALFPSLMQFYSRHPAGTISVKNTLNRAVTDLKAEVRIKKYMDFPSVTKTVQNLQPGEQIDLDVFLLLNEHIFEVQENLPLQVSIELSYGSGDRVTQSHTAQLLLYRRSAIRWDDSAKLASFITPHEKIVTEFSHRVAGSLPMVEKYRIPDAFLRAMRICDALGTHNIAYVEDPDSPISEILGNPDIVDTVRFARTTLLIRAGDCDDSTALLASLLESSGIDTAIMTSPGHVFLAFDTGEHARNSWMYESAGRITVEHDDTVWIPIESTVLQEGFMFAWQEASTLITRYRPKGSIEFLPVDKLRVQYPPLPIPPSGFEVVEPAAQDINRLYELSLTQFDRDVYTEKIVQLLEAGPSDDQKADPVNLNRAGILHARFGNSVESEDAFLYSIKHYPDFIPPYVNLAQLYLIQGDEERAASVFVEVERISPSVAARYQRRPVKDKDKNYSGKRAGRDDNYSLDWAIEP